MGLQGGRKFLMAKDADNLADRFETENTGGVLSGFLAEEDEFDRRALWRLGSWAVGAVGAVSIAFFANQSSIGWRRDQIAAADLVRQSQQIQTVAKESQNEARRLASAIDTLNGDRDRLYSRVSVLEQGMDSVTGAIARQSAAVASPQTSSQASVQAGATPAVSAPMVVAALTEVQKLPIGPPVAPVATTAPAMAATPVAAKPAVAASTVTPTVTPPAEKPSTVATVTDPTPAPAPSTAQTPSNQAPSNQASSNQAPSNTPTATVPPPLMESKSMMGPPDPAAGKLIEPPSAAAPPSVPSKTITASPMPPAQPPETVASAPPAVAADEGPEATESIPKVQRTEFGVDVGGANSVGGLRALWRGLLKSRSNAPLAALRPIIVIKESSTGLGMQLRLVAGPLTDAAAAAKICAGMTANDRPCETTVFDGQRLSLNGNDRDQPAPTTPTTTKPAPHGRHYNPKHAAVPKEEPKKPEPSTLSLIFGRTSQ
jgi:hypothetical protein